MQGITIPPLTLILLIFQSLTLAFLFLMTIIKGFEKGRIMMILVTLFFIAYNLSSGTIEFEVLNMDFFSKEIISYTMGTGCAIFFLYYIYFDFEVPTPKYLTINRIFMAIMVNFVLMFVIPLALTKDLDLSRNLFLLLPATIGAYLLVKTYLLFFAINKKNKSAFHSVRLVFGAIALFSLCGFPFSILIFGGNLVFQQVLFNMGFAAILISYFLKVAQKDSQLENIEKFTREEVLLKDFPFDETKVLNLILNQSEDNFQTLGNGSQLDENSVSRLSNRLFKLLNVLNKKEEPMDYVLLNHFTQFGLSKREIEIGSLMLSERTYKEIGEELFIAKGTVTKHASNIFQKVGVKDRIELIRRFHPQGQY